MNTMIPQNLRDLEHFRNDKRVQFKEENVGGVDVVIPCYMIADAEFWDLPNARELRGHTYSKETGELLGVALHKFFNVGERNETQAGNIIWDDLEFPQEKVDGSMINAVVMRGAHGYGVFFKTKKSFYSDVAVAFRDWFWKQPQAKQWEKDIIELWRTNGVSPIFEFYHPDWQVVMDYGSEPRIWWLNARSHKGVYFGVDDNWLHGMERRDTSPVLMKQSMLDAAREVVNVEGWVVYNPKNNELYKVKTEWYLQQHRVRTMLRERDVAELAAQEKLDDVKSLVSAAGLDLSRIEVIEKSVSNDIIDIRENVDANVKAGHEYNFTVKDMAGYVKGHPYFGLIMQAFRGAEPNYVDYFMRNVLKQKYGLTNVYNEKF